MSSLFKIFTNEYEQQKPDVSISLSTKKGPVEDRHKCLAYKLLFYPGLTKRP